jgi:magnesium-transporting ATPase (P-type)
MFVWEQAQGTSIEVARTAAVNTLVMFQAVYLLNSRFLLAPAWPHQALRGNPYVPLSIVLIVGLQLLFTYVPFMHTLFHTAPLEAEAWARIVLIAASIYVIVELEKAIMRRLGWRMV